MELSILASPTLSSSLQQTWSNNNLWLCIFIRIRYKNTILVTASTYISYITPLYYITKWYLRSIPSQICYSKVADSIAHGYDFIETNLGKLNLTKLANNKATKKLKHHQCLIHHHLLIWTQFAHSNLHKQWRQFTSKTMANSKSSIAALQIDFHALRQWE